VIGCAQVGISRPQDIVGTRGGNGVRAAGLLLAMLFPVARHAVVMCVVVFVASRNSRQVGCWFRELVCGWCV